MPKVAAYVACAICGKRSRRQSSSLPDGQMTCHPCRRRRREASPPPRAYRREIPSQTCKACGVEFINRKQRTFCSLACYWKPRIPSTELVHVGPKVIEAPPTPVTIVTMPKWWAVLTAGPCAWCGEHFIGVGTQAAYCSNACQRNAMYSKRGGKFVIEPRTRRAIYERDDFTCQLCREPVDIDADPWSDWYPSLDHIVPQSHVLIPDHSPANLRTAHRWCNAIRGDGTWHADFFEEAS